MASLNKIIVNQDVENQDVPTFYSSAYGVKTTGDTDVTTPPYTDTELQTQADKMMDVHNQRVTDKSPALTRLEKQHYDTLVDMYVADALYVQTIARKVAKTAGDVVAGEAVVLRTGFKLKTKGVLAPRKFEIVASGHGWMHLRVKALSKRAGYAWRCGLTTEEGVKPTEFYPIIFTLECDLVLTNVPTGIILAIQVAGILPTSISSKISGSTPATAKTASPVAANLANKPTVALGVDPLNWSDFIYEGTR